MTSTWRQGRPSSRCNPLWWINRSVGSIRQLSAIDRGWLAGPAYTWMLPMDHHHTLRKADLAFTSDYWPTSTLRWGRPYRGAVTRHQRA